MMKIRWLCVRFRYEKKWVVTHSEKIGKYWYWFDWQIQRQIGNATGDDWRVEIVGPELCPEVLSGKRGVRNPTLHTSRYSYHVFWRDEVYLLFWGRSVRYGESTISREMRLEFLLKCEPEKSSDKRVFGQMTGGQSTVWGYKITDCQGRKGMAELRDRKGSENGFKRGTGGSKRRWAGCPEKGHLMGRLVRTGDWIGSWIRKETAGNYLETVRIDERNVQMDREVNMRSAGG